jgi:hypothetical protein
LVTALYHNQIKCDDERVNEQSNLPPEQFILFMKHYITAKESDPSRCRYLLWSSWKAYPRTILIILGSLINILANVVIIISPIT